MRSPSVLLLLLVLTSFSEACSGLNVHEIIEGSNNFARVGAGLTLLIALTAWLLRRMAALFVSLAAFILHPSWTISSVSGDCGSTKINATILLGIVCGAMLVWDALRRPSR